MSDWKYMISEPAKC